MHVDTQLSKELEKYPSKRSGAPAQHERQTMKHLCRSMIRLLLAWSIIVLGAESSRAAPGEVVFDNTINTSGAVFGPGCCQVGNEITLAGNAREIIELSWMVYSQNLDIVGGIETQIYSNNGPGGSPGTLLWQSGPLTGISISAADTFIDIAVPNIPVPETITVTSRILDSTPVALGRVYGGSPIEGSVNTSWIEQAPGVWDQAFGPWGLRVVAIPEPSAFSLSISAGVLLAGLSRCWAARTEKLSGAAARCV